MIDTLKSIGASFTIAFAIITAFRILDVMCKWVAYGTSLLQP